MMLGLCLSNVFLPFLQSKKHWLNKESNTLARIDTPLYSLEAIDQHRAEIKREDVDAFGLPKDLRSQYDLFDDSARFGSAQLFQLFRKQTDHIFISVSGCNCGPKK